MIAGVSVGAALVGITGVGLLVYRTSEPTVPPPTMPDAKISPDPVPPPVPAPDHNPTARSSDPGATNSRDEKKPSVAIGSNGDKPPSPPPKHEPDGKEKVGLPRPKPLSHERDLDPCNADDRLKIVASPKPPKAPSPQPGQCYADIGVMPGGAEVVYGDTVLALAHPKLQLAFPCKQPVTLVFRKPYWLSTTQTFMPTEQGTSVGVHMNRVYCPMNARSEPVGATITLIDKSAAPDRSTGKSRNERLLGTAPGPIKVPAGASATLVFSKPGYEPTTQTVAPVTGGEVDATLNKSL